MTGCEKCGRPRSSDVLKGMIMALLGIASAGLVVACAGRPGEAAPAPTTTAPRHVEWESLESSRVDGVHGGVIEMHRTRTPGGWLVESHGARGGLVHVPDVDGEWLREPEPEPEPERDTFWLAPVPWTTDPLPAPRHPGRGRVW